MNTNVWQLGIGAVWGVALLVCAAIARYLAYRHRSESAPLSHWQLALFTLPIGIALAALAFRNLELLGLFAIFAAWGMVGELLFSALWVSLFPHTLRNHRYLPIFAKQSSLLNLLPWGTVGAILMLVTWMTTQVIQVFSGDNSNAIFIPDFNGLNLGERLAAFAPYPLGFLWGLLLVLLVWAARNAVTHSGLNLNHWRKFNFNRYLLFCMPFVVSILAMVIGRGASWLILAVVFAILGFFAELGQAELARKAFKLKLWRYQYLPLRKGLTSVVNFIPASAAGFWFLFLLYLLS